VNRTDTPFDPVERPKHYNVHPSGIECIELAEFLHFAPGNALKYVWRSGIKETAPEIEDFRKSEWYLRRSIENSTRIRQQYVGQRAEQLAARVAEKHGEESIASMIKHLVQAEFAGPTERELLLQLALKELQHYILMREQGA
jgi:Protein of unknwon function (DUF3310)